MTASTNQQPPTQPRRKGFFSRIIDWFRRPPAPVNPYSRVPVAPAPELAVSEVRTNEPLTVPALGNVFDFTVLYETIWSAKGLTRETLRMRVDSYAESSIRMLRNIVWPIGREFPPHQPEAAEQAMNEALKDSWCFDEYGEVIACKVTVRVVPAKEVIAKQSPSWERLVELDARRRLEIYRIEYVTDLLTRWLDLVKQFGTAPRVLQAAQLTDREAAAALHDLAAMEKQLGNDLMAVLDRVGTAHAKVGLYEFAKSYDVALRAFEQNAGLAQGTLSATNLSAAQ